MPMKASTSNVNAKLAAGLVIGVMMLAATGLFSVQYAYTESSAALEDVARLQASLDTARQAQVAFKIQVQEWKNILLRGQSAEDFERYSSQFQTQRDAVAAHLVALRGNGMQAGQIDALQQEHQALNLAYHEALAQYRQNDTASLFRTDAAVRGRDRALNTAIDALADELTAEARRLVEANRAAASARYQTLRNAVGGMALLVIVLAAALAVRTRKA